jgi:hypothetical protein
MQHVNIELLMIRLHYGVCLLMLSCQEKKGTLQCQDKSKALYYSKFFLFLPRALGGRGL